MKYIFIIVLFLLASCALEVKADTNTVSTVTGTTTIDKSVPSANAPSVVINNQDVCSTANSIAVQHQILGVAVGKTSTDENCERIKLARSLYGMGMKVASVSLLCQDKRVFKAMWHSQTYCPYNGLIGIEAKKGWEANPTERPDYEELDIKPEPVNINEHEQIIKSVFLTAFSILAFL